MIALIQRVTQAQVHIADHLHASISQGLLVFVCAQRGDTQDNADRLLKKLLNYRVFSDTQGKMNLSVTDIQGELLIVSQFTLAADTRSGTRPSFTPAADPATAQLLYDYFVAQAQHSTLKIATGVFAADMKVGLVNDGPVTFWLHTPVSAA